MRAKRPHTSVKRLWPNFGHALVKFHAVSLLIRKINSGLEKSRIDFSDRRFIMKTTSLSHLVRMLVHLLAVILVSACAPSRQALIEDARLTGDWSRFNKRVEAIEAYEQKSRRYCPAGKKLWCIKRLGKQACRCVSDARGRAFLERLDF